MAIVTAHVAAVQQLYVAYFNRPADYAGLDYWTNVVAGQKGSTALVSAAFAAEAEYKTEYAGLSNADIVNKIYMNLFGRPAEDAGKAFWAAALDSKATTIDKVVADVVKGAQGSDARAYENKVSGATTFTAQLDTKLEQDGYSGAAANALAKAYVTSITNDASLEAAVAPVNLATTVSKVVVAGTPFTVAGALANLAAAQKAKADFLVTADGDSKADTSATDATLKASVDAKAATVQTLLGTPAAGDAVETIYANGSASVRAALIADQQTANAKALVDAQAAVTKATGDIGKVAGLQSAIANATAAVTAQTAAVNTQKAANIDLAAKLAAYNTANTTTLTVAEDGTVAGLITVNATTGALQLASGVTEAKNAGVTALLNASIAKEASDANVTKANTLVTTTQNTVDYLDTSDAEQAELAAIKAQFKDVTVATGSMPTEAQIAEQLAIFKAKDTADSTVYETFKGLVDAFYEQTTAENPLAAALTSANAQVKTANDNITAFTKALAELKTAEGLVTQSNALQAAIDTSAGVFASRNYTIQNVDAATEIGSSNSDIFMAGKVDSTINLFNLQGTDSLYIGSQFTMVKGALTTGNNAVLEAFVNQVGSDTVIKLEKTAFGSAAATPEVVTITLVGVDATTIQLNNGIITSVAPTV
ncbi:DUF4214 domain-containing protein [Massilia alkalitolerans]|jgi:hypothetical protein|uniref:DUF4214 domain-containing protein n=1 Tax=Massilia alkalitolerans TaxID=286638 RepID=UPI0003FC78B2|nr:DUF4214 domain-containing protein [Massilia alkalitolerans]